jgi:hypothetical protein
MFVINHKGDFKKTEAFLKLASSETYFNQLEVMGDRGVAALQMATPLDSGETASSWYYTITKTDTKYTIAWHNSATTGAAPIAVLLQYGHGTRNGGYVQGRDFINPVMQPIFDEIAKEAWALLTET